MKKEVIKLKGRVPGSRRVLTKQNTDLERRHRSALVRCSAMARPQAAVCSGPAAARNARACARSAALCSGTAEGCIVMVKNLLLGKCRHFDNLIVS